VDVGVGHAVITNNGVPVRVLVDVGVAVAVRVVVVVAVSDVVVDAVIVAVAVSVVVEDKEGVVVGDTVGGRAVGDTEATSLPTVKSTPHTWGKDRVAEYTHVGFSLTPLIDIVGPHAKVSLKVRLHVGDTAASGPYN